jgi:hypothetical protein
LYLNGSRQRFLAETSLVPPVTAGPESQRDDSQGDPSVTEDLLLVHFEKG